MGLIVVSVFALSCNFAGLLILVRHGLPHQLLEDNLLLEHDPASREFIGSDRRRMWSFAGMVFFGLGTGLQITSAVLQTAC